MVTKQIEYIGKGTISKVREILDKTNSKKIFLVTGKDSYISSGAKDYFESIKDDFELLQFNSFSSLPLCEDIKKGIDIYRSFDPDIIVAIGGGSVIDMAKSINILSAQPQDADTYIIGDNKINNSGKALVAIPTTAGSGSEATSFAVVYKDGVKYSLQNEYILPKYSIIDPNLILSIPKNKLIPSALDALSQSIESYWSNQSSEESRLYSTQAIALILKSVFSAIEDKDESSMANLSLAAHLSGKAINIAKTTACHAMSYGLSYNFKIPHGIAVAIFLPSVYLYNSKTDSASCGDPRGLGYVKSMFSNLNRLFGCNDAEEVSKKLRGMLNSFGVDGLGSLGVRENDISFLAQQVNIERLNNNPRLVTKMDVYSFYKENL
ncbi:MAG TPA: phosphonoacetaldehyde reductase [Candidatus Paceibacterota bacterium]|nr:phosphonoacetaldehyde reductase [Candidatus Paceibacterota bacterium]